LPGLLTTHRSIIALFAKNKTAFRKNKTAFGKNEAAFQKI
jgi:hypothetical protein